MKAFSPNKSLYMYTIFYFSYIFLSFVHNLLIIKLYNHINETIQSFQESPSFIINSILTLFGDEFHISSFFCVLPPKSPTFQRLKIWLFTICSRSGVKTRIVSHRVLKTLWKVLKSDICA